jgi:outer membrane receptor protein involved in Fe transport
VKQSVGNKEKVMKSSISVKIYSVMALAILLFGSTFAAAQGITTGSVAGVVQDPQGAVVPNATVTVTHLATNRVFRTQTTSAGIIALRDLPTGVYDLKIESTNFRAFESKNLTVSVGKETSLGEVVLQLGSSTETVTVEGSAPLIEATTDQISDTISSEKISSLPMGNSFDSLALFLPGVASVGDASFSNNNGAEMSVNGLRARANNFQIDGQSNNDNSIAGPSIFFGNQDAISEMQVVTNYDAEFGRNTGAVINYVTKSGTNAFHGTAYEFWQGSKFDSLENNEKNPLLGFCMPGQNAATDGCIAPKVPGFVDNRFGGSIGGPVKRDRIWFFGSSNLERQRFEGSPASTGEGVVPTSNGVAQLAAAFPNSPIGMIESTIGPTAVAGGNPTFTNVHNVLVTDEIDPSTGSAFTCDPAQGPLGSKPCVPVEMGSLTRFVPGPFNDYEATGRVDFKLSEKDNFFARYVYQKTYNGGVNFGNGIQVGDWQVVPGLSQQIGLDWTRTFNNAFVNQVRFSYSRASSFFNEQSFPSCNQNNPTACPTDMVLAGSAEQDTVSFGVGAGFPQGRVINVYQLQDNASILKGQHTLKFGAEIDQQRSPNVYLPENNGVFVYSSFNDVIANTPFLTQIALGSPTLPFKEWDLGFYFQDNWRVKSNLTLNLGIRWDWYQQAINLLHDQSVKQQTGSDPIWSASLPLSATTVPSIPQALKNFAPVVGFAWTPHFMSGLLGVDKTVIRGGFRIAYDPAFYNMFLNVATGAPKVNLATLGPLAAQAPVGIPSAGAFGTQIIPALAPLAAGGDPGFASQIQVPNNFRNPYTEQWNFGIQHSFTPKVVAEVRYVGNHAVAQFQELNGNPALQPLIDAGFSNLIPAGLTPCTDPNAPGGAAGLGYANCNFTNVIKYANTASSNYNGLQSELRIANWHGLSATGSYTFSKTIDNASEVFSTLAGGNTLAYAQNPFNTGAAERANSGIDFPHIVGVAVVYDIPAFKGQRGVLGHVLGGWQVNTTYRYTSGQPYTTIQQLAAGSLCDPTGNFGGNFDPCRPIQSNPGAPLDSVGTYSCSGTTASTCALQDFVTGAPIDPSAVRWIENNPAAAIVYGTPFAGVGRNTLRGQSISTANLAVFKNIRITERLNAQFQAQAFNVMNVQFRGVPDPILNDVLTGSFQNTNFNSNGGATFAGNINTDGIGRRRLLFGMKLIF